jgi:phosphotransferase system enzyme I (PtsP)
MGDSIPKPQGDFHLQVIRRIVELVNQSGDLEEILRGVVSAIAESLHFDVVSVYLHDARTDTLVLRSNRGLSIDPEKPIRLRPSEGLTGLAYETRAAVQAMPASKHPRYKYFPETGEKQYESYLGVPILIGGHCLGVLVGQIGEARIISPAEETLFQIIASRLAGVLEVADHLGRSPRRTKQARTRACQGKGASPGFAVGPAWIWRGIFQDFVVGKVPFDSVRKQSSRLRKALQAVEKDLQATIDNFRADASMSASAVNIFRAHLLMISDPVFRRTLLERISEGRVPAETAVVEQLQALAGQFERQPVRYLQERAVDFRDIGERILHKLGGRETGEMFQGPPEGAVLVAFDAGPSLLASLQKSRMAAIVTQIGGETSHAAILARSMGIPAVAGIDEAVNVIAPGQRVLVDGKTGFVFVDPEDSLVEDYRRTHDRMEKVRRIIELDDADASPLPLGVALTANVGFPSDVESAQQHRLRDVGLFRTEFAFMQYDRWPTTTEQESIYEDVAGRFDGFVTVRTLDIGADKVLPYFRFPQEQNPLLGLRSIRFSMEYLDLFRDQLRAILLRCAAGRRLRILLPMVTHLWEVETARDIVEQIGRDIGLSDRNLPPVGVMVEVPGIIPQLPDYADIIDFVSIGTNDLIQYLLAVDRNSSIVGHLYSGFHPAVLRTLRDLRDVTRAMGKEVSVCGELAGTSAGALAMISLGFTHLSVLPSRAPLVRYLLRRLDAKLLDGVRERILTDKREKDIRAFLAETVRGVDSTLAQAE